MALESPEGSAGTVATTTSLAPPPTTSAQATVAAAPPPAAATTADWLQGWATLLAVIAALGIAAWQTRQAKWMQRDQARPYVAASIEPDPDDVHQANLVIKNYGLTTAHDVTLEATPPLERNVDSVRAYQLVWKPGHMLPTLAPGQAWITYWDNLGSRSLNLADPLPSSHDVVVRWRDSNGRQDELRTVLDLRSFEGRMQVKKVGR